MDRRFLGDTLWYPRTEETLKHRSMLNDFSVIQDFEPWVWDRHDLARNYIEDYLCEGDILVTHVPVTPKIIHPKYKGDALNCYFHVDMEDLVFSRWPAVCIAGHSHEGYDFTIGKTRFVGNPFGYLGEQKSTKYIEKLVIEV